MKLSNQAIALAAIISWGMYLPIGFYKGYMGIVGPLPFFIENIISLIGLFFTIYALIRLLRTPNDTSDSVE